MNEVKFNAQIKTVSNKILSSGDNSTSLTLVVSPDDFLKIPAINAFSLLDENKSFEIIVKLSSDGS